MADETPQERDARLRKEAADAAKAREDELAARMARDRADADVHPPAWRPQSNGQGGS